MLLILRACASDWPLGASPEWEGPLCRVAPARLPRPIFAMDLKRRQKETVKHNGFEAKMDLCL